MRNLTIEAINADSAHALLHTLATFQAELAPAGEGRYEIQVRLGSNRETIAVLNTLAAYMAQREAGPTRVGLDGHTYLLDPAPLESEVDAEPGTVRERSAHSVPTRT